MCEMISFLTKLQFNSPQMSRSHVYFAKGVKPSFTKYTLVRNDRLFNSPFILRNVLYFLTLSFFPRFSSMLDTTMAQAASPVMLTVSNIEEKRGKKLSVKK